MAPSNFIYKIRRYDVFILLCKPDNFLIHKKDSENKEAQDLA